MGDSYTKTAVRHTKCGRMREMVVGEGGRSSGVLLYRNRNADFQKPLSRSANERITDGHMLRLAYGDANSRARVVCHPVKNTRELPQLYL